MQGFSTARLPRLYEALRGYVERGEVAGVSIALHRRGEVIAASFGLRDRERRTPMERDTLVRIASMTKPILAVAALSLVEEGRLRLDEPVTRWLPELADRRVLRAIDSPLDDTVPARRAITLRDLLTLRLGIGMLMAPPGTYLIQAAIAEAGLEPDFTTPPLPPDEWMRRWGALPLMYQPGERWLYHVGYDVLSVLLARVTGQDLGAFLAERIFEPLGMQDTSFSVPPSKVDRLSACYRGEAAGLAVLDAGRDGPWARPVVFPSEVVSTADDYLKFGRMLLDLGRHAGGRLLARPTVELMITDQITPEQKAISEFFPGFWDNQGWGMGVSIVNRRTGIAAVPGRFGWSGGLGTTFAVDPREDLVAVLLTQREQDPLVGKLYGDFMTLTYQAIDD